jgi:hypothetical protein
VVVRSKFSDTTFFCERVARSSPAWWQTFFTTSPCELGSILVRIPQGYWAFPSFFWGFVWEILLFILMKLASLMLCCIVLIILYFNCCVWFIIDLFILWLLLFYLLSLSYVHLIYWWWFFFFAWAVWLPLCYFYYCIADTSQTLISITLILVRLFGWFIWSSLLILHLIPLLNPISAWVAVSMLVRCWLNLKYW